MATFDTSGVDQYAFDFASLAELPGSVVDEMLEAEGRIIKDGQAETARAMLRGEYYRDGVAGGVRAGKVKRSGGTKSVYVTFEGEQHGNRVAEIAFVNEFGKHNQPARPFIRTANEKYADRAVEAAEQIYDRFLSSKGL